MSQHLVPSIVRPLAVQKHREPGRRWGQGDSTQRGQHRVDLDGCPWGRPGGVRKVLRTSVGGGPSLQPSSLGMNGAPLRASYIWCSRRSQVDVSSSTACLTKAERPSRKSAIAPRCACTHAQRPSGGRPDRSAPQALLSSAQHGRRPGRAAEGFEPPPADASSALGVPGCRFPAHALYAGRLGALACHWVRSGRPSRAK